MDALNTRIMSVETVLTNGTSQLDAFVQRLTGMMNTVEQNDTTMKASLETKFGELEQGYRQTSSQVENDLKVIVQGIEGVVTQSKSDISTVGDNLGIIGQEHTNLLQEVQKIRDDRTIPMETAVVRIQNDMQTFNGKML